MHLCGRRWRSGSRPFARAVTQLRAQLRQARKELSELLFEQQNLLLVVGPNLEARYVARLGGLELELLQQQVENRRLLREIELCQVAVNQRKTPPREDIEKQLDLELAQWKTQLRERGERIQASQLRLKKLLSPESSAAVRSLYRQLVKRLHPDLHPGQEERERQLWFTVQQAYQMSDWSRLETLLAVTDEEWVESSEELRRIQLRCEDRRDDLLKLRQQFPHHLGDKLQNEDWLRAQEGHLKLSILLERQRHAKLRAVVQEYW